MSIVKSFSFPDGDVRGDMFYIKHNSDNFTVIDCFLKDAKDDKDRNGRKEEIVKEIVRESNGRVCRFISTHPDNDHIAGLDYLDEQWPILNFYAVENNRQLDNSNSSHACYKKLICNKIAIKQGLRKYWLNDSNEERGSSGICFQWPKLTNKLFIEKQEQVKDEDKERNK